MSPTEVGNGTAFQQACIRRLGEVLAKYDLAGTSFALGQGAPPWYQATIVHAGKEHRIEVYPHAVVMHQDDRYFECYMDEELESDDTLVESFATRLDRYLSGGPWAGPEEKSLRTRLKERVKARFGT